MQKWSIQDDDSHFEHMLHIMKSALKLIKNAEECSGSEGCRQVFRGTIDIKAKKHQPGYHQTRARF
jgi:hypothetical protein